MAETNMKVIGCIIKLDYKPCKGCPFEQIPDLCRYWRNYLNAKLKIE